MLNHGGSVKPCPRHATAHSGLFPGWRTPAGFTKRMILLSVKEYLCLKSVFTHEELVQLLNSLFLLAMSGQ